MAQYTINSRHATLVAIDQHARSCTMSAADLTTGETFRGTLRGCPSASEIVAWAAERGTAPFRFAYESGPCGFQLQREISALGHDCDVIAITSIPRDGRDRALKDDCRDAMATLHSSALLRLSPRSRRESWCKRGNALVGDL